LLSRKEMSLLLSIEEYALYSTCVSAIGLYLSTSLTSPPLCRRMVVDCRHELGMPSRCACVHISWKSETKLSISASFRSNSACIHPCRKNSKTGTNCRPPDWQWRRNRPVNPHIIGLHFQCTTTFSSATPMALECTSRHGPWSKQNGGTGAGKIIDLPGVGSEGYEANTHGACHETSNPARF
jgi:hypothetical protein